MVRLFGTVALAVIAIAASWPALGTAQETPATANPAADNPQESLEALFRGLRVLREALTLEDSRRERAIRRVLEKVKADERLQGGYYRFQASKRLLKESDLERGKKELRRMLRDRPEMNRHLTEVDELFRWAARKFAGEDLSTWIEWEDFSEMDFPACHRPPRDEQPGRVFVRNQPASRLEQVANSSRTFDFLWSCAAYELHNIQSYHEFNELHEKALAATISREDYIVGIARAEYGAWLRTRLFYLTKYYPWARQRGIAPDPWNWGVNVPDSFEEWLAQYPRASHYPWKCYGDDYDEIVVWRQLRSTYWNPFVSWRRVKERGGARWEKLRTEILLRERARQL